MDLSGPSSSKIIFDDDGHDVSGMQRDRGMAVAACIVSINAASINAAR